MDREGIEPSVATRVQIKKLPALPSPSRGYLSVSSARFTGGGGDMIWLDKDDVTSWMGRESNPLIYACNADTETYQCGHRAYVPP